jgi:hypothetical protein
MDSDLERLVWEHAGGRCEYCQMPQERDDGVFEFDHIISQQHAGPTIASNLCVACFGCNHYKGPNLAGWDKATKRVVRLFHPRRHSWRRHFHWDGPTLVGRTAIGRVTISVLKINRPLRVLLRKQLIDEGVFPP